MTMSALMLESVLNNVKAKTAEALKVEPELPPGLIFVSDDGEALEIPPPMLMHMMSTAPTPALIVDFVKTVLMTGIDECPFAYAVLMLPSLMSRVNLLDLIMEHPIVKREVLLSCIYEFTPGKAETYMYTIPVEGGGVGDADKVDPTRAIGTTAELVMNDDPPRGKVQMMKVDDEEIVQPLSGMPGKTTFH